MEDYLCKLHALAFTTLQIFAKPRMTSSKLVLLPSTLNKKPKSYIKEETEKAIDTTSIMNSNMLRQIHLDIFKNFFVLRKTDLVVMGNCR